MGKYSSLNKESTRILLTYRVNNPRIMYTFLVHFFPQLSSINQLSMHSSRNDVFERVAIFPQKFTQRIELEKFFSKYASELGHLCNVTKWERKNTIENSWFHCENWFEFLFGRNFGNVVEKNQQTETDDNFIKLWNLSSLLKNSLPKSGPIFKKKVIDACAASGRC